MADRERISRRLAEQRTMREAGKTNGPKSRPRRPPARPVEALRHKDRERPYDPAPQLRLIYDTAPVGLAFLSPDCRYLQINHRLTEICGIPVADHLGRSVR